MKKIIKFNKKNTTALFEALTVGDPDDMRILKNRVIDLRRLARRARDAAEEARKNNNKALADRLESRASELDELADTALVDTLDAETEQEGNDSSEGSNDQNGQANKKAQNEPEDQTEDNGQTGADDEDIDKNGQGNDGPDDTGDIDNHDNAGSGHDTDNTSEGGGKEPLGPSKQANTGKGAGGTPDKPTGGGGGDDGGKGGGGGTPTTPPDKPTGGDGGDGTPPPTNKPTGGGGGGAGGTPSKPTGEPIDGGEDDNEGEGEGDGEGDTDEPVVDIFSDDEDIPQLPPHINGKNGNAQTPRLPTLDEIIKQLKSQSPEAIRGATDALKDIIANLSSEDSGIEASGANKPKTEGFMRTGAKVLTEAKPLHTYSDDDYGNLINSTLDMIDRAYPTGVGTRRANPDDRRDRVHSMDNVFDNAKLRGEIIGDPVRANAAAQAKAREEESKKYLSIKPISGLKLDLYNTIKQQVDAVMQEYQSYDEINDEYADTGLIMKADVIKMIPDEAKPIIDVYFDRSASWEKADTAVGKMALSSLAGMEADDEIKINLYYFNNIVTQDENDPDLRYGSTRAWPAILENIKATKATNVVIMTDSDMANSCHNLSCKIPGCVWWVWKNNTYSVLLTQLLRGSVNKYFGFKTSDFSEKELEPYMEK